MKGGVKREALEVMSRHHLCVISTVDEHAKPESAIVGFSQSDKLELLVGTSVLTRKYANVQRNSHVAVVIGDETAEVQYEGTIQQLGKVELDGLLKGHFEKLPGTTKYLGDPNQAWFLITPTWLRLTVHETPNRVEEMRQFA
ncbi:MAG TPA: pyridoxamine 5'-phosphate oxidase family protein [Candidatus Saccharimonadales bacterium]|jgi:hypothetical protein